VPVRSRVKVIDFPVFGNYLVHVEVTSDPARSMAKYPVTRAALEQIGGDFGAGLTIHDEDGCMSFIFLPYNPSVGTIAHEMWHAVKHMMETRGVELDSETTAYHLGYLVDHVFKFVRGRR
jgi:hypothetical protein